MKDKTPLQKARAYYRFARQKIKRNPDNILWHAFFALVTVFLFTMLVPFGSELTGWLVGAETKKETLEFIGVGIGGVIAVLGALAFNRRAKELARQNTLIEKGHINERFKSAVESLASAESAARVASFYQFYYLAKDGPNFDFRKNIFDILCAHLRDTTTGEEYQKRNKPTEEIQSLLDVLFKPTDKSIFNDMQANLRDVHLSGANLRNSDLRDAGFEDAVLSKTYFVGAHLQGARFQSVLSQKQAGVLEDMKIDQANFMDAKLQRSIFLFVDLRGAIFRGAHLQGAQFFNVNYSDSTDFDGIEIDECTTLPPNITFTDKDGKKYKTDENGEPQEITARE